jgi:hypothetical protein
MYMASVPGTTNEGTPFPGEPFIFPSFGNVGPPYIATLSLPGLTIGLPVWFFSTPVILNAPGPSNASPSPQEHPPHVDPSPSSPVVSSSLSSPSPSESSEAGNQVDKKKKKRKIKKKKNKQGAKLPTTAGHVGSNQPVTVNQAGNIDEVHKPTKTTRKPKFPCRICKGDHLLKDFPGIPKVLEVWSMSSKQPVSSASAGHAGENHQLVKVKLGKRKVESSFLVGYVKVVIKLTFSLVWMKPRNCWKT